MESRDSLLLLSPNDDDDDCDQLQMEKNMQ